MGWKFKDTSEVVIPSNPLDRVIGQDEAVEIAKIAAVQKRHLLLVGPPGTGKSMIAQAIASILPKPRQQIAVLHNPERPEKPILEVKNREELEKEEEPLIEIGKIIEPSQAPLFVSEKLGFRCRRCGSLSSSTIPYCPSCGAEKYIKDLNPFRDLIFGIERERKNSNRVHATRTTPDGKEELLVYEKTNDDKIRVLTQKDLKKISERKKKNKKIIVPLNRSPFVQVTGASETELLGDVKHDPYGGHQDIGTPPYLRVVAGAVHEAHEGVLFIDELSTLGELQRFLLTAMQEKSFPIVGRNPTSTGAIVRVDGVPCDFILVGSVNINDLRFILPALRSRIRGNGYEILLKSHMEDNPTNREKFAQFVAQEIIKDGKIPHASSSAVEELLKEAKKIAKTIDNVNGITLRLRNLSGLIKLAGDYAVIDNSELIERKHVREALKNSKSIEEQLAERYGNWWNAGIADYAVKKEVKGKDAI